jgi:hypothetical protein
VAKDPANVREVLERFYPEYDYSDMDGAHYLKTLEPVVDGDVIEHDGHKYKVLYSWEWVMYYGVPVYMAELEPTNE